MIRTWFFALALGIVHSAVAPAQLIAQTTAPVGPQAAPAPAPQDTQPASQPGVDELVYEVNAARRARWAPIGTDPTNEAAWKPIRQGDLLRAGSVIQTKMHGTVKLVQRPADPPTVMLIEGGTTIQIDELHYRAEGAGRAARSHVSLKVGAVRAGVAEGRVRSDMLITSPSAQLSKRGTDIFRFEYANGRFQMSLSEKGRGLVQAIQFDWNSRNELIRTKSRFMTPGQWVSQRMFQAIESVRFDRNIQFNDVFGISQADKDFLLNNGGIALLLPLGNNTVNWLDSPVQGGQVNLGGLQIPLVAPPRMGRQPNSDGDFGIGQGILPGLFGQPSLRRQLQEQQRRQLLGQQRYQMKAPIRPKR